MCAEGASARCGGCGGWREQSLSLARAVAAEMRRRNCIAENRGARASRVLEARALCRAKVFKNNGAARCLLAMVIGYRALPASERGHANLVQMTRVLLASKSLSDLSPPAPLPDVSAKTGYLEPPARSLAGPRGRRRPHDEEAPNPTPSTRPATGKSILRETLWATTGDGAHTQIISPSARTGLGVP